MTHTWLCCHERYAAFSTVVSTKSPTSRVKPKAKTHNDKNLVVLTGEDELLLHDVYVSAGPPDRSTQHDLLRVVAPHAAHPEPAIGNGWGHTSQGSEVTGGVGAGEKE